MNDKFISAIKPILKKASLLMQGEYVVFGSAVLYAYGINEFKGLSELHDLDIVLKGTLKDESQAEIVFFENDPQKKLYKVEIDGLKIDIGTVWPGSEEWFARIFDTSIRTDGIRIASLETVLAFKRMNIQKYGREKDRIMVKKIDDYISARRLP